MKLKAVISPNLPIRFAMALVEPSLDTWYKTEIVRGCLHVKEIHAAGHYIQWPDFLVQAEDGSLAVEVSFTKLSAGFNRSGFDFHTARLLIEEKFSEVLALNLSTTKECELFVGSMTNKPVEAIDGAFDTLHERDYIVVPGRAEPDQKLDMPAGDFSLKPLRNFLVGEREYIDTRSVRVR